MAGGMLFDGPINNINHNVEEIVNSVMCMNDELRRFSCRQNAEFASVFSHLGDTLDQVGKLLQSQRKEFQRLAEQIARELKESGRNSKKLFMDQMTQFAHDLDSVRRVLDSPGKLMNRICTNFKSVLIGAQDLMGTINGSIGGALDKFFGRRRKRSSIRADECIIPSLIPQLEINFPEADFSSLEDWIASKVHVRWEREGNLTSAAFQNWFQMLACPISHLKTW